MDDWLAGSVAEFLGILVCVALGALSGAVERALVAFGELRARTARQGDGANARAAARLLEAGSVIQTRLLVGRVLCVAGAAVLTFRLAFGLKGLWAALGACVAVALLYALTTAVATTVAVRRAGRLALPLLRLSRPLELAMAPLAMPLVAANAFVSRLYPPRPEDAPEHLTEVDMEQMIEKGEEHGSITEEHADLLRSVLEFKDTVVREVMVPRTQMVAIDVHEPLREVVRLIVEKGHSRYPVYSDRIDRIEGVLYAKDLFRVLREQGEMAGALSDLIRTPAFFAAESQKVSDLLREMQSRRVHLAVVIDEFGGTSGMVTLEDIIEEIVGEIRDEHDYGEVPVRTIISGHYLANAEVSVYDLAEQTGLELPDGAGAYESLGGMIVDMVGRVPSRGESVRLGGYDLIVREADERHVTRVEVVRRGEAMLGRK